MKNRSIRNIILIWLGWSFVMIGFQHWIGARLELKRPDYALRTYPEINPRMISAEAM